MNFTTFRKSFPGPYEQMPQVCINSYSPHPYISSLLLLLTTDIISYKLERGREFARRLLSYFNIPPQSALSSTSLEGPLRRLPHGSDAQYMPSAPRSSPPTNTFASDLPTGSAIHVVSSGQAPNMQCNNGDNGVNGVEMVEVDTLRRRPPRNLKIPGGNEK